MAEIKKIVLGIKYQGQTSLKTNHF